MRNALVSSSVTSAPTVTYKFRIGSGHKWSSITCFGAVNHSSEWLEFFQLIQEDVKGGGKEEDMSSEYAAPVRLVFVEIRMKRRGGWRWKSRRIRRRGSSSERWGGGDVSDLCGSSSCRLILQKEQIRKHVSRKRTPLSQWAKRTPNHDSDVLNGCRDMKSDSMDPWMDEWMNISSEQPGQDVVEDTYSRVGQQSC